jgi:hypothetical protein
MEWTQGMKDAWNEAIEAAALICDKRSAAAAVTVGVDAEGQLEGASDDIRALLKAPF